MCGNGQWGGLGNAPYIQGMLKASQLRAKNVSREPGEENVKHPYLPRYRPCFLYSAFNFQTKRRGAQNFCQPNCASCCNPFSPNRFPVPSQHCNTSFGSAEVGGRRTPSLGVGVRNVYESRTWERKKAESRPVPQTELGDTEGAHVSCLGSVRRKGKEPDGKSGRGMVRGKQRARVGWGTVKKRVRCWRILEKFRSLLCLVSEFQFQHATPPCLLQH